MSYNIPATCRYGLSTQVSFWLVVTGAPTTVASNFALISSSKPVRLSLPYDDLNDNRSRRPAPMHICQSKAEYLAVLDQLDRMETEPRDMTASGLNDQCPSPNFKKTSLETAILS